MFPDPDGRTDFVALYAAMSEGELLDTARAYDNLQEVAQAALRAEFARRGLEPPLLDEGAGQYVARKLVTVRRYRDLSEAIVARAVIESAGLFCFLQNENIVRLDWQISNFVGGIRLQVEEADAAAAADLLSQPVEPAIYMEGDEEPYIQPRCPRCDSLEITFQGAGRGAALTSLFLLSVPLPATEKTWLCNGCGLRWSAEEQTSE